MVKPVHPVVVRPLTATRITMPRIGDGAGQVPLVPGTGRPDPSLYQPVSVVRNTVGWFRLLVDGRDRTYFRGVPCEITEWTHAEPFGYGTASIKFPASVFDDPAEDNDGGGSLPWLRTGKPVEIELWNPNKEHDTTLFEGFIVGFDNNSDGEAGGEFGITIECQGALYQADLCLARPEVVYTPEDIGTVVPRLLNSISGRRYARVREVRTGIKTRSRGAWEPVLTGRVQDLLSEATTPDGTGQWTLQVQRGRRPRLVLKDMTTIHWTVYQGAPGVSINVHRDVTQAPTTIFGRGVDDQGVGWGNLRTPDVIDGWRSGAWNYASPDSPAWASYATDVRVLQQRLRDLGYKRVTVNGNPNDPDFVAAIRHWQKSHGETVTGVIRGQTWTSLLYQGEGADRSGQPPYYAPLATLPVVEEWDYDTDGSKAGRNGSYNPDRLRVERFHPYPEGTSREDALAWAHSELQRDRYAGWTGTITMDGVDPVEGSRWKMLAGQNIHVWNWQGQSDKIFHITEVSAHPMDGRVTLTVDTRARDLLTLDAVEERNREARNPARRPGKFRRNELTSGKPTLDGDLVGKVRVACETGRWSIARIPLGTEGTVEKVDLTNRWNSPMVVILFGSPVTPRDLAFIGDPLDVPADSMADLPGGAATRQWLADRNSIGVLGGPAERLGYWPGHKADDDPQTGRTVLENLGMQYVSLHPPYIWVAVWCQYADTVRGSIWQTPADY